MNLPVRAICFGGSLALMVGLLKFIGLRPGNPTILEVPVVIEPHGMGNGPKRNFEATRLFEAGIFIDKTNIVSMGNYIHYAENANVFHAYYSKEKADLADAFKSSFLDGHPDGSYSPELPFLYPDQDGVVRVCNSAVPEAEAHHSHLLYFTRPESEDY